MNKYLEEQREKQHGSNRLIWSTIFLFCICVLVLSWRYSEDDDQIVEAEAIKDMQQECAKNCSAYGITQNDLIGPTLEHWKSNRAAFDYLYSWHSTNSSVVFKVHIFYYPGIKVQTQYEWNGVVQNTNSHN